MSFGYNPEMEQQPESEGQSFFFGMMPPEAGTGTEGGMNEDCCDAAKSGLIDYVQNIQNTLARRAMEYHKQYHDEHLDELLEAVGREILVERGIIDVVNRNLDEHIREIRRGQLEANRGLAMAINTMDCSDFKEMLHGVGEQDTIDADNIPAEFFPGLIAIHQQLYQEWLDCEGTEGDFGDTSRWGDIFTASQDILPIDAAWALLKRWGGRTWSADDDFSDYVDLRDQLVDFPDWFDDEELPPDEGMDWAHQLEEDMMREGKQPRGGGGSGKKREFIDQQDVRRPSGQRSKSPGGRSLRELEGHKPTADARKKFDRRSRRRLLADKLDRERKQRIAREQMGQPVFSTRYMDDSRRHLQEPRFTDDEPEGRHPGSILDIDDMIGVEQGTQPLPRFFRRYADGKLNQPISEVMGTAYPKDWNEGEKFYDMNRRHHPADRQRVPGSRAQWYHQHGEDLARKLSESADIHPNEEEYDTIANAILSGRLNYRDLSQLMPGLSDIEMHDLVKDIDPEDWQTWEHLKELNRHGQIPRDGSDPAWDRLQELNAQLGPLHRKIVDGMYHETYNPINAHHYLTEGGIPEDWHPMQEEVARGRLHGGDVTHHLDAQENPAFQGYLNAPDEMKEFAEMMGIPIPEAYEYIQGVHAAIPFDEDSPEYQRIQDAYENAADVQRREMTTRLPYSDETKEVRKPTFAGLPFREGTGFTMGEPMDIAFDFLR